MNEEEKLLQRSQTIAAVIALLGLIGWGIYAIGSPWTCDQAQQQLKAEQLKGGDPRVRAINESEAQEDIDRLCQ